MDTVIQVQILDKVICISYSANTLEKSMHPTIYSPFSYEQIMGQPVIFNLGMTTGLGEGKL